MTEDYLVTLRLKSVGFRTVYLNERLSLGLAPEGLKEYVTQRSRWALGFVQICRGPLGPLRRGNGLQPGRSDQPHRDLPVLVGQLLLPPARHHRSHPLLAASTCTRCRPTSPQTLSYYLPYFVSQIVIMGWMAQGRVMPVMSDVTQLLAATQIVKAVAHGLIKPKGHKFLVTAKGGDRSRRFVQWPLLRLFAALLALTIAGVVWAFLLEDGSKLRDSSALCLFWSWYNILDADARLRRLRRAAAPALLGSAAGARRGGDRGRSATLHRPIASSTFRSAVRGFAGAPPAGPGATRNRRPRPLAHAGNDHPG